MRPERTTRRKTCVLRVCSATQDPLMWPKLAQVGPGIALLDGFQGLLGALWGRLGAGHAPGSATAAPSSPQMRKKHVFSCVFYVVFSGHTGPPDVAQVGPRWPRDRAIGRFPGAPERSLGSPWRCQRSGISHSGSQQPPDAENTYFIVFFFAGFQASQGPQMWPKLAQGGPGIALFGGFQGLLGALWGRLGAGNAPGSATAAPGSPWRRENTCFLVFLAGSIP